MCVRKHQFCLALNFCRAFFRKHRLTYTDGTGLISKCPRIPLFCSHSPSAQNVLLQLLLKRIKKKKKKLTVLILAATFQPALLKRSFGTANYSGRREWAGGGGVINPFGSISKPPLTVTCFLFVCVICFLCVLAANRQTDATRGQNQNEILRSVGTRACGQMKHAPQPGAFCPCL